MGERNSAWSTAISQLEAAAFQCGLDQDVLEFLKRHQRIFVCNFAVRMDDGKINFFEGYRIHHCHALGAIGGGTRFHPQETLDDVKALSLWMTIKNSLNGIPVGGREEGWCCLRSFEIIED
jgi:glutamate dehydrogenase